MNLKRLLDDISSVSLANVFNPYRDVCDSYDCPKAPVIRRKNLLHYLESIQEAETESLWMGRDLGYRGGRRTGLALTDEFHMEKFHLVFPTSKMHRATTGEVVKERTATEIWNVLFSLNLNPMLWNVFPFHPHEPNNPMSNRKFSAKELSVAEQLNSELITALGIKTIVAIGNDAEAYSKRFGVKVIKVRHPSYGGTAEFRKGIRDYYHCSTVGS